MNPFDLTGPDFLWFYLILSAIVLTILVLTRHLGEPREPPRVRFDDPYLIAYLRGGKNEALRVATVSLVDRRLLIRRGETALSAAPDAAPARGVEKALVWYFRRRQSGTSIYEDVELAESTSSYRTLLIGLGLVPDEGQVAARRRRLWVSLVVLLGVAAIRIVISLRRQHLNLVGLQAEAAIAAIIAVKIYNPRRTIAGNRLLTDLRSLFAALKARASLIRPGGKTSEMALLAAVFGVSALSAMHFPYVKKLFPKAGGPPKYPNRPSSCASWGGPSFGSSCGGGGGGAACGGCGSGGGD